MKRFLEKKKRWRRTKQMGTDPLTPVLSSEDECVSVSVNLKQNQVSVSGVI